MEPRELVVEIAKSIKESVLLKGVEVAFATSCRRYRCCSTERQARVDEGAKRSQKEHLA